ncbi:ImmA/IrrE family metallo-endopeptidase [Thiohalorhabdus denitrificans]|uniref:Uncharacterized protein n=1 Tax=Thiohalorhabdus denitrificans TaxID=381306 RepID=A0A1G5D268_9GAMM|nr:ImmA/IrrE family metallo-endopeptidase [Thiohalorhabdus denitrificans]SCY08744.1 protein of unknown function [Thiohalorhabdus denitrificans]
MAEEEHDPRNLLSQLFEQARIYERGKDYKELLDFVVRLRNFAPFNSMLLHIQRPGLKYAASAKDWADRFERGVKEDARPLLILWPFGPVALVFDVDDTFGGKELPKDVAKAFRAHGTLGEDELQKKFEILENKRIFVKGVDHADGSAGYIWKEPLAEREKEEYIYPLRINKNHKNSVQFSTLIHELGHLFLGHLGGDEKLKIKDRSYLGYREREIEAESVSYIVCKRCGVTPESEKYLLGLINSDFSFGSLDVYPIFKAAGRVETELGYAPQMNLGVDK